MNYLQAHISPDGEGGDTGGGNNFEGNGASYSTTDGSVVLQMEMQRHYGMDRFFEQVEDLRKLIAELRTDVKSVQTHHSDILSKPIPDESKYIKNIVINITGCGQTVH